MVRALNGIRRITWVGFAIAASMVVGGLQGCGGGGGGSSVTTTNPYAGMAYSTSGLGLGSAGLGSVSLKVSNQGAISGTVTVVGPTATTTTYNFTSALASGSANFTAPCTGATNTSIAGTLPSTPSVSGGQFSLVLNGTTYGPFTFGTKPYSVNTLPSSDPAAYLNDSGELLGLRYANGAAVGPYTWTAGTGVVPLTPPVATGINVSGIAADGSIAGVYTANKTVYGFVYSASSGFKQLGFPTGYDGIMVNGMFSNGDLVVTASAHGNPFSNTFVYDHMSGAFTQIGIGTQNGILAQSPQGYVYGMTSGSQYWLWHNGVTTPVTVSNFDTIGGVSAGNAGPNGELLGSYITGNGAVVSQSGSPLIDTGKTSTVVAYNGTIAVGRYQFANADGSSSHAFMWTKAGGFVDLNTVLPAGTGITLFTALSVNTSGQILCAGESSSSAGIQYFLLTPPK